MFFGGSTFSYGRISPTSPTRTNGWTNVVSPFKK